MRIFHPLTTLCITATSLMITGCQPQKSENPVKLYEIKNSAGEKLGVLSIKDMGKGGVEAAVYAETIPEGAHGIHFHVKADCSSPDFKSAGGHINPMGKKHGLNNPDGPDNADMPNIIANDKGIVKQTLKNNRVTLSGGDDRPALLDADGSALVIHANPDDQITQPIGGAGARIACAEIRR